MLLQLPAEIFLPNYLKPSKWQALAKLQRHFMRLADSTEEICKNMVVPLHICHGTESDLPIHADFWHACIGGIHTISGIVDENKAVNKRVEEVFSQLFSYTLRK